MESLFEFLFKYRPLLFQRGHLRLAASWPVWVVVGGGALLALVALFTYLPRRGDAGPVDRGVLASLRLVALAILVLCLLQPVLVLSSTVRQRNFVAVLLDDSRSMTIADQDGAPRSSFVTSELGASDGAVRSALADRFSLRFFRFGDGASRTDHPDSLTYSDRSTHLAPALDAVREELNGVPLSGVVVVSDGSGLGGDTLRDALLRMRAAGVPVYAVGVGAERVSPDIEVSRVEMPRHVLQGSTVAVDVVLTHRGYDGRTVSLQVDEEGVRVAEQSVTLPEGDEPALVRVHLKTETAGPRQFRFAVPPQDGEAETRNNARDVLTSVAEDKDKVLYVEGQPRFEVKFIRRAVEDDDLIQLVVLQRTAESKFLRLNVDDADELAGGFPTKREELFRYRALVLGSVGAGFFTQDQLQMIGEFVSQRGGSVLMLGGPEAFAQGDYQGTPVADALPVVLSGARPIGVDSFYTEVKVEPTAAGREHAALQLPPDSTGAPRTWSTLPPLSTVNPIREVKPGATVLLTGSSPDLDRDQVVLAWQRYGKGKGLALTVQDTWVWQMDASMPLDDQTQETFWRQLLRWMVDGVPDPMTVDVASEPADPGHPTPLAVQLSDSAFVGVNDADVTARITAPDGAESEVRLGWTGDEDGAYRGSFTPPTEGLYRVDVEATRSGHAPQKAGAWLRAAPSDREFFDAGMNRDALQRMARETGGQFYTAADVAGLPEDLQYTGSGVTVVEERDLWDMPALFLVLVLLVGGEWSYRRWRGLA